MTDPVVLVLDEGTSSARTLAVAADGSVVARAQREFAQHFPKPGWVEHDPEEIWQAQVSTLTEVVASLRGRSIAGIGITNQRETIVLWERRTGTPVARAIVWQDRRTAVTMNELLQRGLAAEVAQRTGLTLDPYFSASKLAWLLDSVPDGRERAARGELAAGTIDSWLLWKLTSGRAHATDVSNASRTMLMNLESLAWDPWLLGALRVPREVLPTIVSTSGVVAEATGDACVYGCPVAALVGDQQAALFGQGAHERGQLKVTFGTGCFVLRNDGCELSPAPSSTLATVAWKLGEGRAVYAHEGSVFMGGAAIQWLRDGLRIIRSAPEVNELAASVPDSGGVVVVPAMTGLGAPHWDSSARGAIMGLTRGSTAGHIARATLEGIAMQVVDVVEALGRVDGTTIRVDGGACASDLLMQTQADLLGCAIERPRMLESTALGAAFLAGLATGVWSDLASVRALRQVDRRFEPLTTAQARRLARARWAMAVGRTRGWEERA